MFHADRDVLRVGSTYELAILQETQRFLDWCWRNQSRSKELRTPDGSRVILDSDAKMDGLLAISCEMDALAREVAREQAASLRAIDPTRMQIDEVLRTTYVPAAA